jgi:opacity protein-like surface antigen
MRLPVAAVCVLLASLAAPAVGPAESTGSRGEGEGVPGSVVMFQEAADGAPAFNSYTTFGTVGVNFNGAVGVEGEFGVNFGFDQEIPFVLDEPESRPPTMVAYSGNVIAHLVSRRRTMVPYVVAGAGGLTLVERPSLGVTSNPTFLTLSAGVGIKFNVTEHWGIRTEYRYLAVVARDGAPDFFGHEHRIGHRLAAGLTFGGGR